MNTATTTPIVAASFALDRVAALGPHGSDWGAAQQIDIPLEPTPLESQPSAYVQAAWAERQHGVTPSACVAAAIADGVLRVRLRWTALNPRPAITDNNVFADACALLFPLNGEDAPLETMGDTANPVQAWQWRAGTPTPFVLNASGPGTSTRQSAAHGVSVDATWNAGEWSVVFARALAEPGVPLKAGGQIRFGIAVWQGAAEERAGLAAHTPRWLALALPR